MRFVRRPVVQSACAVIAVAAGLGTQFATPVALVEDVGMAAIVAGLGALAMLVPSVLADLASRGGDGPPGPPPATPQ